MTGFETSEEQVNEENSSLNFKPHFVAIADTHAWQWQTNSFAENQLGEFINKIYGGGVAARYLIKKRRHRICWTAEDGRKAYGFVTGSLIFFGNDESSIEKVQAVRRGEADPIAKSGKVPNATAITLRSDMSRLTASVRSQISSALKRQKSPAKKSRFRALSPACCRNCFAVLIVDALDRKKDRSGNRG